MVFHPGLLAGVLCAAFAGVIYWLARLLDPGVPFDFEAQPIRIISSEIAFGDREYTGASVVVLGTMTNTAPTGWKSIKFQVEFDDGNGRLVDAGQREEWNQMIPGHAELAFKVSLVREFPTNKYVGHRVRITSASDARSWFR